MDLLLHFPSPLGSTQVAKSNIATEVSSKVWGLIRAAGEISPNLARNLFSTMQTTLDFPSTILIISACHYLEQ